MDPSATDYWESRGLTSDFSTIMPDAKTIIVAVYPYQPFNQTISQGQGRYSAHYQAYPKGREAMKELGAILADEGYEIVVDSPIPAKRLSYQSSLGKYGKNGLVYHPKFGSFITLHTMLTNAELKWDTLECDKMDTVEMSDCGTCTRCIDTCPTQAIADDGIILVSKCMRFHMGSPEIIPIEIRGKMGDRMLGCEECQLVCPKNSKLTHIKESTEESKKVFNIRAILANALTGLKKLMNPIAQTVGNNYARPQKVLSMAVIVAGNSGDQSYVPLLAETLQYPNEVIRAHSAWAIGKLGGEEAKTALINAEVKEGNIAVRNEIKLALEFIELH
ncbi:MAG: hypothetical protein GX783_07725 [Clostridiales bacterium]|nr:hypothetical protein [Clostridiales bacterium]